MEVDAVRRGELHRARLYTPGGWRDAVRAAEGPRERLVGRVAGLEGDVEHADVAGDEPVRRALEPDPPAKPARRLAAAALTARSSCDLDTCIRAASSPLAAAWSSRLDATRSTNLANVSVSVAMR